MYKGTLSRGKEILIHLIFWLIWIYFYVLYIDEKGLQVVEMVLFKRTWYMVYIFSFYFNYFVILPRVFRPFKWRKAILGALTAFVAFAACRYLIEQVITVWLYNQQNYFPGTNLIYYFYDNLFYASQPIILSTVLWLVIFLVRLLEYNKVILEENKNTEIKFLKAQINPHFIFNTLNNIYSMVYFQSDKSLPAIEKLSQIMRFTTYESQKEKIKLVDEMNYIQAYIELEQLRHQESVLVNLTSNIENEHIEIPPFILSPLVENALKHGATVDAQPIEIELNASGQQLTFIVKNQIGTQKKDKLGGIGLDNLKKRLEIYYPESHSLNCRDHDNLFVAEIQIALK